MKKQEKKELLSTKYQLINGDEIDDYIKSTLN